MWSHGFRFGRARSSRVWRLVAWWWEFLAVWYPQVCGNGYSEVNAVLHGRWPWQELAIVLVIKIVATSANFGSGAVGGVFIPTLFVGSSIGYLFGVVAKAASGIAAIQPEIFALIGMGAFLAAPPRAPLMAIILIFEITLDYEVILPLMLACVVGYYTARSFPVPGIYSEELRGKKAAGNSTLNCGACQSVTS